MHEECIFIQVRSNTAISPVHDIPTLQTCRIVYYILLYKPKSVALCFRLDQSIDLFRGACAVKGNVQVAGHVKRIDNGAAFNA